MGEILENKIETIEEKTVLKLRKPVMIDGEEKKEINYDFENLTGQDVDNAFAAARKNGYMINGPYEMDPILGGYLFCEAANIDYSDLKRFSARDFKKAGTLGRNFFITDLADQAEDI
ncbi:hypothetical protein [Clostridium ihumii]|uniref:hypothetical protein n=1 Tax=Clostridium ihumii TaxID=1470356 RepID=UPI0006877A2D|nr:hypothetical protein [Clostridium ihumii]